MIVSEWLQKSASQLERVGIGTARLDALVLLEDVTGKDRAWLLAHPEYELSTTQVAKLQKLLNQRAQHTPLAYLRGKTEFYGREFVLTPDVLEPRPESETMIDLLKELVNGILKPVQDDDWRVQDGENTNPSLRIADVGAGSGALGITAQLELPHTQVELLEIDEKALKVAKINVDKLTPGLPVTQSDLIAQTKQDYDILLCNLPYVPDDFHINQAAKQEPRVAIFGGPDGLDIYRKLFQQLQNAKKRPLFLLLESLPPQHSALKDIAEHSDYQLAKTDDFIQVFTTN